jgi:hypothetical protein
MQNFVRSLSVLTTAKNKYRMHWAHGDKSNCNIYYHESEVYDDYVSAELYDGNVPRSVATVWRV